jgi:hypothetical protein
MKLIVGMDFDGQDIDLLIFAARQGLTHSQEITDKERERLRTIIQMLAGVRHEKDSATDTSKTDGSS